VSPIAGYQMYCCAVLAVGEDNTSLGIDTLFSFNISILHLFSEANTWL